MEIEVLETIPAQWSTAKPLEEYETTLLYTGFSRFNTVTKVLSTLVRNNGRLFYSETPWESGVLSRCYASELIRMRIYSKSPAVWAEVVSPDEVHFFQQKQED